MSAIELSIGRSVHVDEFHYSQTYAGLLEGRPNSELNRSIIERLKNRAAEMWPHEHTCLIEPELDCSDPEHPALPPACYFAALVCHKPIGPNAMGSSLVVIWFAKRKLDSSIQDIIQAGILDTPWEDAARDFDW